MSIETFSLMVVLGWMFGSMVLVLAAVVRSSQMSRGGR